MKILIAGASGFIGRALIPELLRHLPDAEIVALSRRVRESDDPRVTWKRCDLFSMKDIQEAMAGCDEAFYLVHSMLPSADLAQGSFYDFDLIMADNFARSAKKMGLKHIVYLGGMIPPTEALSWHLKSRLEVEESLRFSSLPVTTLRAGLIIGKNGSSFEMLRRLVIRLPFMICPAWTNTESQPIALSEILQVLVECVMNPSVKGKIYDVGGPEVLTYQSLILKTAEALGLKRKLVSFNLVPLRLSRFWVSLITGAPKDLVYPLVLSLKHRMVADPSRVWTTFRSPRIPVVTAIRDALGDQGGLPVKMGRVENSLSIREHEVRSIQRLHHPPGKTAEWVAEEYFNWLPHLFAFLIRVNIVENQCAFSVFGFKVLVLEKSVERSGPDRQLLYIKGGLLVSKKMGRGRLEFRDALGGTVILAAIHEFVPSLPWVIYRYTQALIHVWVMERFNQHLKSI